MDHLQAACKRIEDAGYRFQKKLTDGRMRHIAFVLDPDDYWVEVIGQKPVEETENVTETDVGTYHMVGRLSPTIPFRFCADTPHRTILCSASRMLRSLSSSTRKSSACLWCAPTRARRLASTSTS